MSNVVSFKKRKIEVPKPLEEKPTESRLFRGWYLDEDRENTPDELFKIGLKMLGDYNFREALNNYPDMGVSSVYTKQEILAMEIAIQHLATAAVFARDIVRDVQASSELVELYIKLLNKGIISLNLKFLPEHLVGFTIWLGEDIRTDKRGQHPIAAVMNRFGMYSTCWKPQQKRRK